MGSFCSCLSIHDLEEYRGPNGSTYGHCICLRCLTQQLVQAYSALFRRGEVRSVPSSVGTASLASAALVTDNSLSDTYCSPPRPLPFDDPRCSQIQRDGLISRHDKPSSHLHEESEPLRSNNGSDIESKSKGNKLSGTKIEGGSKLCCPESSLKHPLADFSSGVTYIFSSSEEEDVCPTCLEEYTSENPRIVMQCFHHFHLGCIYEWMERSEACPVCGKVMVFNETT